MKSQIYIANLKELGLIKFELLMRQINLKFCQIYPLFAKSKFSSNFNRHIKFNLSKAKFLNKISQNLACSFALMLKFKA